MGALDAYDLVDDDVGYEGGCRIVIRVARLVRGGRAGAGGEHGGGGS